MFVPSPSDKIPPCQCGCPNGNDVRGWLAVIAQRHKTGLDTESALRIAWERLTAGNPFPAVMGRICPHPCESACSRGGKDGPVAIHVLERYLGDWAVEAGLRFRRDPELPERESVGVIGGGPAGLSFAYQMARRGYRVTLYESSSRLGGMLLHGIPEFRLPERVLESEIERIVAMGIDVRLDTCVGRDIPMEELRTRHAALFLGIGAQIGKKLHVPGEDGPGVWSGTEFLSAVNRGDPPRLGKRALVVGGGNTAIDAARAARRLGAEVSVVYRRTRDEMPVHPREIGEAIAEGVRLVFLSAPTRILRQDTAVIGLEMQRMSLGEPDESGRRRPMPVPGQTDRFYADSVIVAVSQVPDWDSLGGPVDRERGDDMWLGGDVRGLGIAGMAISQGRQAAEAVHARLRGIAVEDADNGRTRVSPGDVKPEYYPDRTPVAPPTVDAARRLAEPDRETEGTIDRARFLEEVARCFSCGLCFGCQHCWTYCNGSGFTKLVEPRPGAYFALSLDRCEACGKCVDVCPSGYLSPNPDARRPT